MSAAGDRAAHPPKAHGVTAQTARLRRSASYGLDL
mgnify:CR=1 FL=1